jgi:hypothetical protein
MTDGGRVVNTQDWIKEFWQVGNWIVGCEVVQTFTLLYAVTKPEVRPFVENPRLRRYFVAWMIVLSVAFCSATFWTSAEAIRLQKEAAAAGSSPMPGEGTLWIMVAGRIVGIVLLTALCIFALFANELAHGRDDASKSDPGKVSS